MSAARIIAHECVHAITGVLAGGMDEIFVIQNNVDNLACCYRRNITNKEGVLASLIGGPLLDEFIARGAPILSTNEVIFWLGKSLGAAEGEPPENDLPRVAELLNDKALGQIETTYAIYKAQKGALLGLKLYRERRPFLDEIEAALDALPFGAGVQLNVLNLMRLIANPATQFDVPFIFDIAAFERGEDVTSNIAV